VNVTVRQAAEADLEAAFDYYEAAGKGLGTRFTDEFRRSVDRIMMYPHGWQSLDATFRRCRMHRFPYGIIYRVDEHAAQIAIVAVHHLSRAPDSWRGRAE
jgi:plasmid stabilization system protein ParE